MYNYLRYTYDTYWNKGMNPIASRFSPESFSDILEERVTKKRSIRSKIVENSSDAVLQFISRHIDVEDSSRVSVLSTQDKTFVSDLDKQHFETVINFKKMNLLRYLNQHLKSVHEILPDNGYYIGRVETYWERKINLFRKVGRPLGEVIWLIDFVINRVIPKTRFLDEIYYFFTNGRRTALSKAEILGRLVYNGFELVEYEVIDGVFYFVARKEKSPSNYPNPTFRPFVKLNRVGKNGKMFQVYKLRTMHPYSEYLQEHVVQLNGYNEVGKPANDFRVARWGKALRKLWLDEMPQLLNVLRGEMKLVGIRPLSKARFKEFPADLKVERIKYKPGCFPPYVALNMPDDKGNIEAERIYLADMARNPGTTDLKYFSRAVFNILTNRIRSS